VSQFQHFGPLFCLSGVYSVCLGAERIKVWLSHHCLHLLVNFSTLARFFVSWVYIQCALVQNASRYGLAITVFTCESISALWPAFFVSWVCIQCVLVQNTLGSGLAITVFTCESIAALWPAFVVFLVCIQCASMQNVIGVCMT